MRGYGCIKDDPDDRDHRFGAAAPTEELVVPDAHSLVAQMPPVMDQGQSSTCTVHGTTAAYRYNLINTDRPDVPLSRAQLYWDAGVIEGDTGDGGRQIRDVVKAISTKGVAREDLWGFDRLGNQPTPAVYDDAALHLALEYQRVNTDRASINGAIFIGHPVIFGVPVYKAFESDEVAKTGIVPMPSFTDSDVGLHCMLLVGYDSQYDYVLNSWGQDWGQAGYCQLPRGYLEKYGSDFWTIFIDK